MLLEVCIGMKLGSEVKRVDSVRCCHVCVLLGIWGDGGASAGLVPGSGERVPVT